MPKSAKPTKSKSSSLSARGKSLKRKNSSSSTSTTRAKTKRSSSATSSQQQSSSSGTSSRNNKKLISQLIKESEKQNTSSISSSSVKQKPLSKRFSAVMKQQSKKNASKAKFSLFGWSERYHLESDPTMYTKEMIQKRKKLRNEKALKEKIDAFIEDVYQLDPENGHITRDEYIRVHESITRALHSNIKPEEMKKLAEEDWKKDVADDSNSAEFLTREKLQDGIFELVDLWTTRVELQEYLLFLDTLKVKMRHPGSYNNAAYNVLF